MKDNRIDRCHQAESGWKPCPPGIIKRVAVGSGDAKRRQFLIKSATSVVLAGGGILLFGFLTTNIRENPGGQDVDLEFGCVETRKNLNSFIAGRLEGAMAARISEHLQVCNHCRSLYQAELAQLS